VRYYDGKSQLWLDEWDSRGKPGAPKAILIELTLLQGKAEPVTVRQWVSVGAS